MSRIPGRILVALALLCVFVADARAERRVALLIGNGAYETAPLKNPGNDVAAMRTSLTAIGFDVVQVRTDLGRAAMSSVIDTFETAARGADMALVFYSGHGIEVAGTNYLVPIDAKLANERDVKFEAVPVDDILAAIDGATRLKLVLLDACRDNPFVRDMKRQLTRGAVGKGLVRVDATAAGLVIAYATAPGQTALDGDGPASPFTSALIRHLPTPGQDIRLTLGQVRDDVAAATEQRQQPFVTSSLGGATISLAPGRPAGEAPPSQSGNPAPTAAAAAEAARADFLLTRPIGTVTAWNAFLTRHPDGLYADLAREEKAKLVTAALPAAGGAKPTAAADAAARPQPTVLDRAPAASRAAVGETFAECSDCPRLVVVPAGSTEIGAAPDEPVHDSREEPRRRVTFARAFAIGADPVTFTQWDACVAAGGCDNFIPGDMGWGRGDRPVIFVSWNDARSYVAWLSNKTGARYRLPSEAEWEHAARACRSIACAGAPFWFGRSIDPSVANYDWRLSFLGSPKAAALRRTEPVGRRRANDFGLRDVVGNVAQWTEDCWVPDLKTLPDDGRARSEGNCSSHVLRGGSWKDEPTALRSAARNHDLATTRQPHIGFRVVRELSD